MAIPKGACPPRHVPVFKRGARQKPEILHRWVPELPTTTRWCVRCGAMTVWKFRKRIGHSRCTVCGGCESRFEKPKEVA